LFTQGVSFTSQMASMNLADLCKCFVVICIDGDGVPISFPLGSD
jgi:hypothetical protein